MAKKKIPADINQLAKFITDQTTEEKHVEELPPTELIKEKNPYAVALGKLGGLKGGKARAEKLTAEQRKEIAKKAAQKRWKSK